MPNLLKKPISWKVYFITIYLSFNFKITNLYNILKVTPIKKKHA